MRKRAKNSPNLGGISSVWPGGLFSTCRKGGAPSVVSDRGGRRTVPASRVVADGAVAVALRGAGWSGAVSGLAPVSTAHGKAEPTRRAFRAWGTGPIAPPVSAP